MVTNPARDELNPARDQLNRGNDFYLFPFAPEKFGFERQVRSSRPASSHLESV